MDILIQALKNGEKRLVEKDGTAYHVVEPPTKTQLWAARQLEHLIAQNNSAFQRVAELTAEVTQLVSEVERLRKLLKEKPDEKITSDSTTSSAPESGSN